MISTSITIKAPAGKIWEAITNYNQMKEWYFDIPDFELKEGASFNFYESGNTKKFHHQCVIKKIQPSKKLSHTWTYPDFSSGESIVTWLFAEENDHTIVTLQHSGIENLSDGGRKFSPVNFQTGWDGLLVMLKNYMNGLRKQIYQVEIHASPEKVWDILLNDETYRQWANFFCKGSYYSGELKQGSRIHFLSPEGNGMYSNVVLYTPSKEILFQHIGEIKNFQEQQPDEASEKWAGAFEYYTLKENNKYTTLTAEVDLTPESLEFFNENFPKGLQKVKEMSEH